MALQQAVSGPRLSELYVGQTLYTPLAGRVLAVVVRREDGWCVYVDAVPGLEHRMEWQKVAAHGTKVRKELAEAVVRHYFHPGFVVDLPYAY